MYLQCNHLRTVPYYDTLPPLSDVPSRNHWNMRGCRPEFLNNKNLLRTWDANQNSNGWWFFSWHLLHSYLLCGCSCMVGWLLLVVSSVCVFVLVLVVDFLLRSSCSFRFNASGCAHFSMSLFFFVVAVRGGGGGGHFGPLNPGLVGLLFGHMKS